jgi:hypothetical protein
MDDPGLDRHIAELRRAAPAARRAAHAHCKGAIVWGWLACRLYWRLTAFRVLDAAAALLGQALFAVLVVAGAIALAVRGFAGLVADLWRAVRS